MITEPHNLDRAFHVWQETRLDDAENADSVSQLRLHLDQQSLIRLAAAGGLDQAAAHELEHLDHCPLCLAEWAAWRRAVGAAAECSDTDPAEDTDSDDLHDNFIRHQTYGFLEAAASGPAVTRPLVLESHCGTYRLEILPDRQPNNTGMVVLHRLISNPLTEVTVRDRQGVEIISGTLENDRIARIHKDLDKLDLSIWTVS